MEPLLNCYLLNSHGGRVGLTKLSTKLTELEAKADQPTVIEYARSLPDKLKSLHQEFKTHQLAIIDRTNEEGIKEEQEALDNVCVQRLISISDSSRIPDTVSIATK